MKDLGDLHYFLGIEVIRTPKGILISQRHYVLSMLFKFGIPPKVCDPTRFRQIVGSLIYLTITRPDISYPVGVISQLMSDPPRSTLSVRNAYFGK